MPAPEGAEEPMRTNLTPLEDGEVKQGDAGEPTGEPDDSEGAHLKPARHCSLQYCTPRGNWGWARWDQSRSKDLQGSSPDLKTSWSAKTIHSLIHPFTFESAMPTFSFCTSPLPPHQERSWCSGQLNCAGEALSACRRQHRAGRCSPRHCQHGSGGLGAASAPFSCPLNRTFPNAQASTAVP